MPNMALDEFFTMYNEFENNFWKFWKSSRTNSFFKPHFTPILSFLGYSIQGCHSNWKIKFQDFPGLF